MRQGNVTERRQGPPEVGVSVILFALAPSPGSGSTSNTASAASASNNSERNELWIPLVRRAEEPFRGMWALPGGDLKAGRSLEWSAYSALESTTSLRPGYLEQLYAFGDPQRSSGGLPMVSIVYWALVSGTVAQGFKEHDNVKWFPESQLPPLAFDHADIIAFALSRLRSKLAYPYVASRFVGPRFTLRQLHDVYEVIAKRPIDLGNFRRKILASGQLEDTGEKVAEGRQRPAAVYRYAEKFHTSGLVPEEPSDVAGVAPDAASKIRGDESGNSMGESTSHTSSLEDVLSALTTS
ncbi:NUDIX domain-containing protein [Bifidobacterium sp. ESL0790]|uniref:NUDIX hydrolase n=1 Tax=Bifidobacterium sp. ESL0790 TaxID=2983233 RepID=UPI0023F8B53F|nr:NUDIX domain-containing protein [Bifidobacterium sp. ESL0790]WEV72894.1 NUDIX domain-containing protein [Bifidobacterium sp. ESL0790]